MLATVAVRPRRTRTGEAAPGQGNPPDGWDIRGENGQPSRATTTIVLSHDTDPTERHNWANDARQHRPSRSDHRDLDTLPAQASASLARIASRLRTTSCPTGRETCDDDRASGRHVAWRENGQKASRRPELAQTSAALSGQDEDGDATRSPARRTGPGIGRTTAGRAPRSARASGCPPACRPPGERHRCR